MTRRHAVGRVPRCAFFSTHTSSLFFLVYSPVSFDVDCASFFVSSYWRRSKRSPFRSSRKQRQLSPACGDDAEQMPLRQDSVIVSKYCKKPWKCLSRLCFPLKNLGVQRSSNTEIVFSRWRLSAVIASWTQVQKFISYYIIKIPSGHVSLLR